MSTITPSTILLTGATGFLGKVVLEELIRRSGEYRLKKIIVLIRSSKDLDAQNRFDIQVASSPCFNRLENHWQQRVEVVQGDLTHIDCGLDRQVLQTLCCEITHIINCAASVDFDLPLADAARANIGTALNILSLAKACHNLWGMVHTSTSYVASHNDSTILPVLVPLPYAATEIYQDILHNRVGEEELLKQTGYPNTYTLTKGLAEHLYLSHKDSLPLTILRPSIISCSWRYPTPGWVDSKAALAGFITLMAAGYLRVVAASRKTILDVVPVDVVANDIIDVARLITSPPLPSTWSGASSAETLKNSCQSSIVHSVSGVEEGLRIDLLLQITTKYFQEIHAPRKDSRLRTPCVKYLGPRNLSFHIFDFREHRFPLYLTSGYLKLTRNPKLARKTRQLALTLRKINNVFPYYTNRTFDFEPGKRSFVLDQVSQHQGQEILFTPESYVQVICDGVKEHLLKL